MADNTSTMDRGKRQQDKQMSTKHYTENLRSGHGYMNTLSSLNL